MALLEVKDLRVSFFTDAGEVRAVNGISFNLDHGEVLGIVGESGSGKSVTAYSIMQILASTAKINPNSSIKLDGQELVGAGECPVFDKYDEYIPPELLREAYAKDRLRADEILERFE